MGSDDRDSAVYAPFDAIKRHYGHLHRIKDIREALQLAPKVNTYDLAVDGSGNVYVIQQPPGSGSPATVYKIRLREQRPRYGPKRPPNTLRPQLT